MADALEATLGPRPQIRVEDASGTYYPGVTQKFNPGELTPHGEASLHNGFDSRSENENDMRLGADIEDAGGSLMTPLSMRAMPQLDNFPQDVQPNRVQTPHDPTRPFKISLAVFITLIVCVVLFLIFTVMFLRTAQQTPAAGPGVADSAVVDGIPPQSFNDLENRTTSLLQSGKVMEARKLWLNFQNEQPNVRPADVAKRIDLLTSKLPLSQGRQLLAKRREELGTHFIRKNNAVAYAYFTAAALLDDSSSATGLAGSVKQMLSKQLNQVTPDQTARATALRTQAEDRLKKNQSDETTENLLLGAVDADYTDPQNWFALGEYYQQEGRTDDARVVFSEAYKRATTGNQAKKPGLLAEISSRLDELNR
jgi:hypothetical protein